MKHSGEEVSPIYYSSLAECYSKYTGGHNVCRTMFPFVPVGQQCTQSFYQTEQQKMVRRVALFINVAHYISSHLGNIMTMHCIHISVITFVPP